MLLSWAVSEKEHARLQNRLEKSKSIRETKIGDSLLKTSFETGSTFKVRNKIISNQCVQNVPNGSKKGIRTKLLKLNLS